jgi:hypothetical protein
MTQASVQYTIRRLLQQELGRNPLESFDAESERAAEGVYAWFIDHHQQLNKRAVAQALQELSQEPDFVVAVGYAVRLLQSDARLAAIHQRVVARRHPETSTSTTTSAITLAKAGDVAALRQLSAGTLRLALQAVAVADAAPLMTAWHHLPMYETERRG